MKSYLPRIKSLIYQSPLWFFVGLFYLLKYFHTRGYFRTLLTKNAEDLSGNPIPWISYSALDYLESIELKRKEIFEWGSGSSTKYFMHRQSIITSVEDSKDWYSRQRTNFENSKLIRKYIFAPNKKKYINAINLKNIKYDLIFIDGSYRYECVRLAPKYLKKGGIILLDNSERFPEVFSYLKKLKFGFVNINGFGPINHYASVTTIFKLS